MVLEPLLVVLVLLAVVALVAGPLRRPGADSDGESSRRAAAARGDADRADLEAAREAKYREIRDAELDYRTGKLTEEDFRALDRGLRAEALEILDAIERAGRGGGRPVDA